MASTINGTSTGNGGLISTGDDSGILNIQTNETTAISIDASQNVGIGATTPADALNIGTGKKFRATHSASVYQQIFSSSSGNFINAYGDTLQLTADSGAIYLTTTAAQPMVFQTSNADRMRIDSSGYLLVGCTAYPSSSVAGAALSPSVVSVNPHRFSVGSGTGVITVMTFVNGNGIVGAINTSGSNTVYSTSSDYRLKKDIAPMTGSLQKVSLLKPCTYKWKSDNSAGQGFIAHELAEVFPDAVIGEKDAVDADGEIKSQQIDTSFLVATLTAAIQELKAINDTQAETLTQQTEAINALTARIVALETA